MPKLYEYLGIYVYFYGGDHPPIHVHGRFEGRECKAEIEMVEGEAKIRYVRVKGKAPLPPQKQRDFEVLVEHEAKNIIRAWEQLRDTGTHPAPIRITRRVR